MKLLYFSWKLRELEPHVNPLVNMFSLKLKVAPLSANKISDSYLKFKTVGLLT